MDVIAGAVGSQILSAAVAAVLTGIGTLVRWFVAKRLPARRTWRYLNASELSIVLDTSYIDTGHYRRPVAGLGQVRALSVLVRSLTHAYRDLDLEKVRLSAHLPGSEMLRCLAGVVSDRRAVENMQAALAAAGASLQDVISTRVLVASARQEDLVAAWEVVRDSFADHDVPSTLMGVTVLGYKDQLVEIEAVAAVLDS